MKQREELIKKADILKKHMAKFMQQGLIQHFYINVAKANLFIYILHSKGSIRSQNVAVERRAIQIGKKYLNISVYPQSLEPEWERHHYTDMAQRIKSGEHIIQPGI